MKWVVSFAPISVQGIGALDKAYMAKIAALTEPEVIEADQMFIAYGVLQFLNRERISPDDVRELAKLEMTPKKKSWKARPQLVCIRAFNAGSWSDVRLES